MLFTKDFSQLLLLPESMEGAVTLPDSTVSVPALAFSHNAKLTAVQVGGGSASFSSIDGALYSKDGKTLLLYPRGKGKAVVIPGDVTTIGPHAFVGNTELSSLVVLGHVTAIDEQAFSSSVFDSTTVALAAGTDYAARKAVWEEAGFTLFAEPAQPGDTEAPQAHESGFTYTLLSDYTLEVSWTGDENPDANLVIPSSAPVGATSYRVSAIADSAFANRQTIHSVAIPSSVKTIGTSAFAGCPSLTAVTLEEGLVVLRDSAFERTALEEVVLPTSVSEIGNRTFAECAALARIVSLSGADSVSDSALEGCTNITILVPYREDEAYSWSPGIPSSNNHLEPYGITAPEEPLLLEKDQSKNLFEGESVHIPASADIAYSYPAMSVSVDQDGMVTSKAAGQATVHAEISLGNTVLCSASREVNAVEGNVDKGNNDADQEWTSKPDTMPATMPFTAINLSLQSAGDRAGVVDLLAAEGIGESVTIDGLVYTVRGAGTASVRMENTSITKADILPVVTIAGASRTVTEIEFAAFYNSAIASASIPTSVTTIGGSAFGVCNSLTALNIPASVTLLGASIVVSSLNLSAITVEEGSKHCAVIDGVIYLLDENGNPSRCIGGSTASVVGTIHLPETTLSIANRAFSGCINMTGAILPEGLISIESCAFQGASIASLNIPSSLVDASESNIYPNCYYLTSVSVAPDNPKYMVIENTVYEKDLLGNPSKIMSGFPSHSGAFTLPETVTEMGLYAFHGCYKITSLTLPASLTSAGRQPISGTNLQEIICYSSRLDPRNSANIESNLNATVYLPEGGTINGISPDQMKAMWQEAGFTNFAVAPKKVVSFESDGGSSVFPLAGDSGFTPIKPADPTKQGYTFAGWYTDATLVNQYTFDTPITINTTLYAKWMPDRTVIFNANGGTPELSTQVVSHNAVVTQPGNPIREGYTFQGWYTEQTNGTKWNFAAAVTADMTLWARWELNTYTSVFHPNNGGADIRKDVAHGSKVAPPTVSKPGYTFAAWCRDEALTQSFDFDTPVTSNLELWAQWTGLPYTITFDPAEGSGAMAPQAMTYGTKTTLNANAFTRDGYTFTGWNTEKLGTGTAYANKEEVLDIPSNGARDITLYAQWSENTYAIEFVPNPPSGLSAAGTMAAMTNITYNESVILTSNGFACSGGFVFDFWTLDRQGTGTHYANAAEVSRLGSKTQNNETVRLYAQWKGSPYTVSYNKTYADVTGVMSDDTFAYGGWYSLTDNAFVRPGYTFAGWARSEADAQKGVVVYLDGDSVKDLPANTGSSITLYAVWTKQLTVLSPVNPVITIDAQGKPTSDSSTYFESSTEVPVEIVSATCSTVAGPNGTASVFPDTTQWGNIIVTLSSNGTTKNFFLNDSSALLLGFAIPAKTDAANVKLPVTFGMKFLDTVDIEYVKDKQVAVASLVFSFKVA